MSKEETAWIWHYRKEFDGQFLKPNYEQFMFNKKFCELADTGHFNRKLKPGVTPEEYEKKLDAVVREVLK